MTICFYYGSKLLKLLHKAIKVFIFVDLFIIVFDLVFLFFFFFIYFTRKFSPTSFAQLTSYLDDKELQVGREDLVCDAAIRVDST